MIGTRAYGRGTLGRMARSLCITRLSVHRYTWQVADLGVDYNGFNNVYQAGSRTEHSGYILTIDTDAGITGEYVGGIRRVVRPGRRCSRST